MIYPDEPIDSIEGPPSIGGGQPLRHKHEYIYSNGDLYSYCFKGVSQDDIDRSGPLMQSLVRENKHILVKSRILHQVAEANPHIDFSEHLGKVAEIKEDSKFI